MTNHLLRGIPVSAHFAEAARVMSKHHRFDDRMMDMVVKKGLDAASMCLPSHGDNNPRRPLRIEHKLSSDVGMVRDQMRMVTIQLSMIKDRLT